MPKKLLERLGLIEPVQESEFEIKDEDFEVPDLEKTPNLEAVGGLHETSKQSDMTESKLENIYEAYKDTDANILNSSQSQNQTVNQPINSLSSNPYDRLFKKQDTLLSINEIYDNAGLERNARNNIFMVDALLKTLPDSLPPEIKRETVLNIMKVTDYELEVFLKDAYTRIDSLNTVLEETVATTHDIFSRNDASIAELESRIEALKNESKARKELQEKQSHIIQFEIQKIVSMVEFIKPKR